MCPSHRPCDSMSPTLIELQVPKCSLKYELSLNNNLQTSELKRPSDRPSKTCLDRMMKQLTGTCIKEMLQAATIDVDEEGVMVGAGTVVVASSRVPDGCRRPDPIQVIVNRTYLILVDE